MKLGLIISLLISVVFLQLAIIEPISSQNLAKSLAEEGFTEWEILDYNSDFVGGWYALDWSLRGYWAAEVGDTINYTISHYNDSNLDEPYIGNVAIGNFSASVPMSEVAMSLILSVYPWNPGLITHTNWTWHREQAHKAANDTLTASTLEITESNQEYLGKLLSTIRFVYIQDPAKGNQNTTLVYAVTTGLLLYANTELNFGTYYKLEIGISETDIPIITASGFDLLIIILTFSPLLVYCGLRRRKNAYR